MKEETKKRPVAVLIPYYKKNEEVYVFIQKRSLDAKRLPGYFGFFGGGIEENESPEEGIVREIKEELNIDISDFQHFAKYEFYGSILDVYILEVQPNFADKLIILEGEYGRFFNEDEIMNEKKVILENKTVLGNFFGKLKRNNPYL